MASISITTSHHHGRDHVGSQTLAYDHLERLTGAVSGTRGYGTLSYGYYANGKAPRRNRIIIELFRVGRLL